VCVIDGARLAFTTDSFVVRPLVFPGGDIGTLAVNGTVNDLAMCGARPLYLSAGLILEEGLPFETLRHIVRSMREAAAAAGVHIVTGDTKVVDHGKGDGVYVNTAGVGAVAAETVVGPDQVQPGDVVLLSGDIGRHGIAVMAVREGLTFETTITSDCAPLAAPVLALLERGLAVHCLRDLTRGGLASALVEIADVARRGIAIDEQAVPVTDDVQAACASSRSFRRATPKPPWPRCGRIPSRAARPPSARSRIAPAHSSPCARASAPTVSSMP
jgi:hydrogenase expression/formation protein HypE